MPKELKFNPVTGKVEQTEVEKKGSKSEDYTTFLVSGDNLKAILGFAGEDKLDVSTPAIKGRAVNIYVRAAVEEFIKMRQKKVAVKPAAPAVVAATR